MNENKYRSIDNYQVVMMNEFAELNKNLSAIKDILITLSDYNRLDVNIHTKNFDPIEIIQKQTYPYDD